MDFILTPYRWRGKTYKTVTGLCRAVIRAHGSVAVSFSRYGMHVHGLRDPKAIAVYIVERRPDANVVANEPNKEV